LRERETWPTVDAIVITHFHLDHWGDLVPWVRGRMHLDALGHASRRPELWVPPNGETWLRQFGSLAGYPEMFERVFELREYQAGAPIDVAGYRLSAARVPHYQLEAYAFRLTDERRTLAYSGDAGPSDVLSEVAWDADLFVCEATLATGELDGTPRGHLSLDEALGAFERSGAKRLLVTHRPDELVTGDELELARDGLVQEV
jgi:ribonuclease BN (tRNA processing enzyme)